MHSYKKSKKSSLKFSTADDGLTTEKTLIKECTQEIQQKINYWYNDFPRKNARISEKLREFGNKLYESDKHAKGVHEEAWIYYNKSIAYAPKDSKELAMVYWSRSTLLFHLKKFEDCAKDCRRGMKILACNDMLRAQFKLREIECLVALKRAEAKDECNRALVLLQNLSINDLIKSNFMNKVKEKLKTMFNVEETKPVEQDVEWLKLLANEESPCASKRLKIELDKNYNRCIMATEDIRPGEILTVEKCYFAKSFDKKLHMYCCYCMKTSLTLVSCELCTTDVYCSEKCRSECWRSWHQFECNVFPYLWDTTFLEKIILFAVKIMFVSVHKAGSIDKLRDELVSIQESKDVRTRGFSDKVFDSSKPRSVYSLPIHMDFPKNLVKSAAVRCCEAVYYLATRTNFFERTYRAPISEIFKDERIVFIGAVILRSHLIQQSHYYSIDGYSLNITQGYQIDSKALAISMYPFCSLFKHSCVANATYFCSKDNEMIVYAKEPIKKGSQIFISYSNQNYIDETKVDRQTKLKSTYIFQCSCLACKNNWTKEKLKPIEVLLEGRPKLLKKIDLAFTTAIESIELILSGCKNNAPIPIESVSKNIAKAFNLLAQNSLIYSVEFEHLHRSSHVLYVLSFGNVLNAIPDEC